LQWYEGNLRELVDYKVARATRARCCAKHTTADFDLRRDQHDCAADQTPVRRDDPILPLLTKTA
jgi:hypothetical protein